jgi:hypothetical protein
VGFHDIEPGPLAASVQVVPQTTPRVTPPVVVIVTTNSVRIGGPDVEAVSVMPDPA